MKRLKTYFTFLNRNKLFTSVNVAGLSISMMFVLLIANMVTRQLTVDKDMKDADRTYVFTTDWGAGGHYQLGDRLQSRYPEIEEWCAIGGSFNTMVERGENDVINFTTLFARKNFFDFFGFQLTEGSIENALVGNNHIVLTQSGATRLFGTVHALGKTVKLPAIENVVFTVTGIMEDFDNSIFSSNIEAIIPQEHIKQVNGYADIEDVHMSNAGSAMLFFRFPAHTDPNAKNEDIVAYLKEIFWPFQYGSSKHMEFVPIRDFYFSDKGANVGGINQYDFTQVLIFLATGILILLMAVFNYVSMSVAQTSYRAKEMATCRLLGSSRSDIFWRMIEESLLLTTGAFLLGFVLAKLAEPYATDLFQVRLDLMGDLSAATLTAYLLFILLLSFVSGFAPATILSHYNPLDVVKGTFRRKTKALYLRLLNIFQSGLTIAMLACVLYLSVQIHRILTAPLGYEYGNILTYPSMADQKALLLFRNEAQKQPFVKRVSFSMGTPINGGNNNTMYLPSADSSKVMSFQTFIVDSAFIDMFHIQITDDRHMSYHKANYFVSESAMKTLKEIGWNSDYFNDRHGNRTQIAGQFKDFKIRSLLNHDEHPLRIQIAPTDSIYPWNISIEVQDGDPAQYKKTLDQLYSQAIGGYPFDSTWYSQQVKDTYSHLYRINSLIGIFTAAAFIISLLGLTAMSIYFIAQRKRDMAVRKVFGSSDSGEMIRLLRFSLGSLCASLLIAVPLTWIGIRQIDKVVTFDSSFPLWVPVSAFLLVILLSLGTVYLISLKATRENPIHNLKTE